MWEEIKTAVFSFYIVRSVCKCVCVWVCVRGEKMPPMQLFTAAVWLMDRVFCWEMLIMRCFDLISQAKGLFYYTQNIPLTGPMFHWTSLIKCWVWLDLPSANHSACLTFVRYSHTSLRHSVCFPMMTVQLLCNWVFSRMINGFGSHYHNNAIEC